MTTGRKIGALNLKKALVLFLLNILSSLSAAEGSVPQNREIPVIAIEPVLDRIGWYMSHKAYTFQARLSAELFTRWKCHISARNIGLLLHQERSLSSLEKQLAAMPRPQWIVGGSYQKGRRINSQWHESDIEFLLVNADDGATEREVFREKAGHYDEADFIAGKIAERLGLQPRRMEQTRPADRRNETWAVLPFPRILNLEDFERSAKFSGTDLFVYTLQQSGKLKHIISRENMRSLLAEHKLDLYGGMDAGSAAGIGRLLAADRILCGMVTGGPGKDTFRLDILSVDCNTGVVVNAFTGTFNDDTCDEVLARAAMQILNTPDLPPPSGKRWNPAAVDVESKRLLDTIRKSRFQSRSNSVLSGQILSLAESYYLLNAKYPYRCLVLCQETVQNLFYQRCPEHWRYFCSAKAMQEGPGAPLTSEAQSRMAANFLLPVLERVKNFSLADYRDSTGRLKFRLLVNADRCDEAENVFRNKVDHAALDLSDWDMGTLEMRRRNYRKGGDYFLQARNPDYALYAYYLAGEQKLAWQTGLNCKPLFVPYYAEEFLIWVELMEKYGKEGDALKWLENFEKYCEAYSGRLTDLKLNKNVSETIRRLKAGGRQIRYEAAKELFAPFAQYPVCFQPLGNMPEKELTAAADILKQELGIEVRILPVRPMPASAYEPGHHAFSAGKLEKAVRYALGENFPGDGSLFLILSADAVHDGGVHVLFSAYPAFGMASFSRMPVSATTIDIPKLIAVTAARWILNNSLMESRFCGNYPCMMAAVSNFGRSAELDFKICSECLPLVRKGNVRRALRRTANRNWKNHYSEEEIKHLEKYRKEWK